jgi:putative hemin transport protein
VPEIRILDPEEIRRLRGLHPEMRERDFARIQKISEAQLLGAFVGDGVIRLRADVETFLDGAPSLGEVLALTRNESAVHEKIGPFENAKYNPHASIVLGDEIDLRIFPGKWTSAFAVEKTDKDGAIKRSLQFFDAAGDAVHKVHLREASDVAAYHLLVERLRAEEQSQVVEVREIDDSEVRVDKPVASPAELRAEWDKLTDTHQFFPMLKRLNLSRHQAVTTIEEDYAWPLDLGATRALLDGAKGTGLPIMAFVGNRGCIQIHSGPIEAVEPMGPWLNVLDKTFHMHLRLDHITEVWAVRKPTSDGHVTSLEAFGADNKLIIQFFGQRQEGTDERAGWRSLVEGLPRLNRSNAA